MILRDALDGLAAVLFPAPCRICEATLVTATPIPICAGCLDRMEPLGGPACEQCGRPFVSGLAAEAAHPLCHACRRGIYAFDVARSYARYNDAMHGAIMLLKYERVTRLAKWFAARLEEVVGRERTAFAADVVVPVPLYPLRQRERGYNQAELIARPLARHLGMPLEALLKRMKPRPDKLLLSRSERWKAVRGAYEIQDRKRVDKARILLVDDVFTTGATLDACARALRGGGASEVFGLTVARVLPNWSPPGEPEENQSLATSV